MNEIQNIDTLTAEILILKSQTAQNIIEIGKRLISVKQGLPHGGWGNYLKEKVDFSQATANKFMRISEEYSNLKAPLSLGSEKLWLLLEVPEAERESFAEENDIENISTREMKKAIKEKQELEEKLKDSMEFNKKAHELANLRTEERDEAKRSLDDSQKKYTALEAALAKEKDNLKKEKEKSKKEIQDLQSFIGEAQVSGNDEEVERLQASLQEIQNDLDSSAKKIDELEAQLKEKAVIDVITAEPVVIEKIPEETEKELEELRKKVSQNSDPSVMKFKLNYEKLQDTFKSQLELMGEIKNTNPETHEKFKNAIEKLISGMLERL